MPKHGGSIQYKADSLTALSLAQAYDVTNYKVLLT